MTTSSEALLAGKAPTFRLLVWAVDASGEPVPSVTYVVSESFVVATKRVKHAIKSDIPSVADHVSKLVHIGKATVDKLLNLRQAAADEGFEINVPDELNCVDKVGQFQQLVELSEMNTDLKNKVRKGAAGVGTDADSSAPCPGKNTSTGHRNYCLTNVQHRVVLSHDANTYTHSCDMSASLFKFVFSQQVRHLLKLSPEKWDEVAAHAQGAVMPDFRPRVWWCPAVKAGLLFSCKNGAVMMDQPIALVKMGVKGVGGEDDQVIAITQLDPQLFNTIPKLKQQAMQSWYAAQHPGWAIYWKDGQQDPAISSAVQREQVAAGQQPNVAVTAPPTAFLPQHNAMPRISGTGQGMAPTASAFQLAAAPMPMRLPTPPPVGMALAMGKHPSPFAANPFAAAAVPANIGAAGPAKASPFAVPNLMDGLANHFPPFPQQPQNPMADTGTAGAGGPANGMPQESSLTLMLQGIANQGGMDHAVVGGGGDGGGRGAAGGGPGAGGNTMERLRTEDLPAVPTMGGIDRGLSQVPSLLGADASAQWGNPLAVPLMGLGGLGGSGSLNGSLNGAMNALIQESLDKADTQPAKVPRTDAGPGQ